MASLREQLKGTLEEMAGQDSVVGMLLVSRDGISVLDCCNRPLNRDMFAAMSAMMMGAAETAVSELGDEKPKHVIIDTGAIRVIVAGATDDLLLVALGEQDLDVEGFVTKMDAVVEEIRAASG